MKPGTPVQWKLERLMYSSPQIGIIISETPPEQRGGNPFPMYTVLFSHQGLLHHCRSSDLIPVKNFPGT